MGGASEVRHRPGAGLVIGLIGALAVVLSLTTLPWVAEGGNEATFSDIRDFYEHSDDLGPAPVDPGTVDPGTVPPAGQLPPDGSQIPAPPVSPEMAPTAAIQQAPSAENTYLEAYTSFGWIGVISGVCLAVLFATLLVPSSKAWRMVTGFLTASILGLILNAADSDGTVGPRVSGAIAALVASVGHGVAIYSLFSEEFAPDPAVGVWVGVAGLAAVVVGCIMGTRSEQVQAYG
jgi:hypothetical protein